MGIRASRPTPTAGFVGLVLVLLLCVGLQRGHVSAQADTAKLTTVLADLVRAVPATESARPLAFDRMPKSAQDAIQGRKLRIDANGDVQVYVLLESVSDEHLRELAAAGATIEISDAPHRRVQARVPVARLQTIAALPFVTFIRLPSYAVRHIGAVTTEGDAILHADAARRQFSLDGTGVKVGVISDGIKGVFASGCTSCGGVAGGPIATGDLPDATGTRNASGVLTGSTGGIAGRSFQANSDLEGLPPPSPPCGFAGAGAEGTALLEIVHDLAPGAQLSFANADTDLAFTQAVNFLASANDVVVDDLGFFGEASDGTSPVSSNTANALNNDGNRIRTYVTSVGNSADEHYLGTYTDSGVDGPSISGIANGGHLHLFQSSGDTTDVLGLGAQPYNLVSMPAGGEVVIFLTWDDPFGASTNNYDLYLVRQSTGAVVARSVDPQTGRQDPAEAIDYVNTGAADQFRIVVQNVGNSAAAKSLNLYSFEPECAVSGPRPVAPPRHDRHNYNTATRSVTAQSDAGGSPVSVISAGAICSASAAAAAVFAGSAVPDESCIDRNNATIEFFSSLGPTLDGRTKPDVSAIDGVGVTGAGRFPSPFFGTSAAAPHVAGIAALLLQAAPCLVSGSPNAAGPADARSTLRTLILTNAVALGGTAPNDIFGYGRADALASVQKTLPVFSGSGTVVASGNSVLGATLSAEQLGFSDPSHCALTRLSWTGGCGTSPGSTISCPFGTTTVSVSASNNGVAFSSPASVRITVTNFGVGVSPSSATVAAGQSASYQVTVTSQGGAFADAVTLGCANLPTGATCSFNPPTVSPGSGSARSTLTIATTPRSALTASLSPLALLLLFVACSRGAGRRRVAMSLPVFLLGALIACGGNNTLPPLNPPGSSSGTSASVSPTTLTFNGQTVQTPSAAQTVTLTNTGSAALTINGIAASGDFAQTNTCGASVAAGASCTVAVTFTPTSAGARTGTLTINDNAANSPQTVSLTGTGTTAGGGGPTPAGAYQVTVTGASGSLTQAGTVTLTVQ
jgi:Subtilase family/Abnormal spindle-like microcephaly-assoc'd, ASPM-SPD-2-Hydin